MVRCTEGIICRQVAQVHARTTRLSPAKSHTKVKNLVLEIPSLELRQADLPKPAGWRCFACHIQECRPSRLFLHTGTDECVARAWWVDAGHMQSSHSSRRGYGFKSKSKASSSSIANESSTGMSLTSSAGAPTASLFVVSCSVSRVDSVVLDAASAYKIPCRISRSLGKGSSCGVVGITGS